MVGDRILIRPEEDQQQTATGLYLPASVAERERVRSGRVVQVGPGYVIPNPEYSDSEPWAPKREAARYLPLQAQVGDYAFFLRKEAIELTFEETAYVIVPHQAILALVREAAPPEASLDDLASLF